MNQNNIYNAVFFIDEVEKFSKRSLNRKIEIITIYEAAVDSNQLDVFRELCFTAKYLVGMMRVLKDGNNKDVSYINSMKHDFSENMIKAINYTRKIIDGLKDEQKKYFDDTFFEKTHSALTNLNELLIDLETVKLYLNERKRKMKD